MFTGDEDDTVYRARVVSVDGDNVTVLCIDYGYTHSLPMKNVYKLKQVLPQVNIKQPIPSFYHPSPYNPLIPKISTSIQQKILSKLNFFRNVEKSQPKRSTAPCPCLYRRRRRRLSWRSSTS